VFEVLISGIEEHLDDGTKNKIEVRNYLTSFEDIFQRISATTQSLELKEHLYDQAANMVSGNQIDQGFLQNALLNNSLILANATDNSFRLDDTGLSLQSLINPTKKMRIIADGIFIANENDKAGNPIWKTGITADGINASVLTAGEINTSLIKVYSKNQPNQNWNALGITSYQLSPEGEILPNRFVRFDNFGFYFVNEDKNSSDKNHIWNFDDNGRTWFENKTRKAALSQIENYSALSITENGFRINLSFEESIEKMSYPEYNIITSLQQGNLYFGKVVFVENSDEFTGVAMLSNLDISINNKTGTFFTGFVFRNNGNHEINSWKFDALGTIHSIYDPDNSLEGDSSKYNYRDISFSHSNFYIKKREKGKTTEEYSFGLGWLNILTEKISIKTSYWGLNMYDSYGSLDPHFEFSENGKVFFRCLKGAVRISNSLEVSNSTNSDTAWKFYFSDAMGLRIENKGDLVVETSVIDDGWKWIGVYGKMTVQQSLNVKNVLTVGDISMFKSSSTSLWVVDTDFLQADVVSLRNTLNDSEVQHLTNVGGTLYWGGSKVLTS
jgi:hypothetical protein